MFIGSSFKLICRSKGVPYHVQTRDGETLEESRKGKYFSQNDLDLDKYLQVEKCTRVFWFHTVLGIPPRRWQRKN